MRPRAAPVLILVWGSISLSVVTPVSTSDTPAERTLHSNMIAWLCIVHWDTHPELSLELIRLIRPMECWSRWMSLASLAKWQRVAKKWIQTGSWKLATSTLRDSCSRNLSLFNWRMVSTFCSQSLGKDMLDLGEKGLPQKKTEGHPILTSWLVGILIPWPSRASLDSLRIGSIWSRLTHGI